MPRETVTPRNLCGSEASPQQEVYMFLLNRCPALWALPVFAALLCNPAVAAHKKTAKAAGDVTVTGCLAKGDEANEFSIKGEDGKTYGLYSAKGVKLADHLNHKVTVTGVATKERGEGKEKKEAGRKEESEHLRVTNLKMVSTTCP